MKVQWFKCIRKPTRSRLSLNTLTNPAVEQSKIVRWPQSPWNQSGRKRKGLWRKDLLKSQVWSSEWNTERVREDASGDSEYDELRCVIGKSAGDCVWRGSRRSVGSSIPKRAICDFQRGAGRWASKSDHRWRTCVLTRLNRNRVMEILRLVCCENYKLERGKEVIKIILHTLQQAIHDRDHAFLTT